MANCTRFDETLAPAAPMLSTDTPRKQSNILPVPPSKVRPKQWAREHFDENTLREIGEMFDTPAAALAFMIVRETVADLRTGDFFKHSAALAFVRSPRFERIVAALGLDAPNVCARCERIAAAREDLLQRGALQFPNG